MPMRVDVYRAARAWGEGRDERRTEWRAPLEGGPQVAAVGVGGGVRGDGAR
jgi:hypothetical protein